MLMATDIPTTKNIGICANAHNRIYTTHVKVHVDARHACKAYLQKCGGCSTLAAFVLEAQLEKVWPHALASARVQNSAACNEHDVVEQIVELRARFP
jgi:hypothetical protein